VAEVVLIGMCGRSGSGKGYVCRLFEKYGIPSIDTDAVYRKMTAPAAETSLCMRELAAEFGSQIVLEDNSLNRPLLSSIVFAENGEKARAALNRITHAHILRETLRLADEYAAQGKKYVIIDAPLLFESGFDKMCRFTVCVCASLETSVSRIMKRDGIGEDAARRRLASQIKPEELAERCDFRIDNELQCDDLHEQIGEVIRKIETLNGETE